MTIDDDAKGLLARAASCGDVAGRPDVAGGPRQVDPGQPARHAAAAAAGGRARARGADQHVAASDIRERPRSTAPIRVRELSQAWADPLGFALENFDAVGAWRTHDDGLPIDASGQLIDGTKVDGVVSLRRALLQRPERFVNTLTEKLLTYALGRGLSHHDLPVVRAIVREAGRRDFRFSALILGIVHSPPFLMRTKA